jgi:glycerol-3-phosphate dehydrogenase
VSEAQAATRDYVLKVEGGGDVAPVLNIYGGKITTYRRLAEAALEKLSPYFPKVGRPWTAGAALPGGDFPVGGVAALALELRGIAPACPEPLARRLARSYGTRARSIVEGSRGPADFAAAFGADLSEREVRYLMRHEWAVGAEDVLWRRSKLGLRVSKEEAQRLDDWMRQQRRATEASSALAGGAGQ